jgi:hypothetical protein
MSIQDTKQKFHEVIDSIDSLELLEDIRSMLTSKEAREAIDNGCTGEELSKILNEKLRKN